MQCLCLGLCLKDCINRLARLLLLCIFEGEKKRMVARIPTLEKHYAKLE